MISFYWPGKSVPEWFQRITFSGDCDGGNPSALHAGFGFIGKYKGIFHVFPLTQTCIRINGAGMSVRIEGQGLGVIFHTTMPLWTRRR